MADAVAAAVARAEFQRKQRDRKRLYRARLKNDMTAMREQVSELEATYEALYAQRVEQQQRRQQLQPAAALTPDVLLALDDDDDDDASSQTQLQQRYAAARTEIAALRHQINEAKKTLSNFDLFTASLECYLNGFQTPPGSATSDVSSPGSTKSQTSSPVSPPDTPPAPLPPLQPPPHTLHSPFVAQLTDAVCQEIIRDCYQQIINRKWTGRSVSSGAEMLGWSDKRFVDGATLQFALAKSFPALASESLMQQTWDILTTERHMRTLQRSTTDVTVLKRVSNDIILLERRANHKELHRIACVHLLVFRIRTDRGYIVAFKALNPPGSPQESSSAAAAATTPLASQWSDGDDDDDDGGHSVDGSRRDDMAASAQPARPKPPRVKPKPKLAWVDTMQWFRFDDLADAAHSATGTHVTIAGRTANCDDTYTQFFLFEVVTFVVRWESAVAGARLLQV